jgi:hypothetical protein
MRIHRRSDHLSPTGTGRLRPHYGSATQRALQASSTWGRMGDGGTEYDSHHDAFTATVYTATIPFGPADRPARTWVRPVIPAEVVTWGNSRVRVRLVSSDSGHDYRRASSFGGPSAGMGSGRLLLQPAPVAESVRSRNEQHTLPCHHATRYQPAATHVHGQQSSRHPPSYIGQAQPGHRFGILVHCSGYVGLRGQ